MFLRKGSTQLHVSENMNKDNYDEVQLEILEGKQMDNHNDD